MCPWVAVAGERIGNQVSPFLRCLTLIGDEASRLLASAKKLLADHKQMGTDLERFKDALKKAASHYREVAALYKAHAAEARSAEVKEDYLQLEKAYVRKAGAAAERCEKAASRMPWRWGVADKRDRYFSRPGDIAQGVARLSKTPEQLHLEATKVIRQAREATQLLMREGLIPPTP